MVYVQSRRPPLAGQSVGFKVVNLCDLTGDIDERLVIVSSL
jgi:hypothetical protein